MAPTYCGQFVISRSEREVPDTFRSHRFGGWNVYTDPKLPVSRLVSQNGELLGCLLGNFIRQELAHFVAQDQHVSADRIDSQAAVDAVIQDLLRQIGGRFVLLIATPAVERVYLDAAGSLACVYDAGLQAVASTAGLLLGKARYFSDLDQELAAAVNIAERGWYPGGVTPHRSVSRLLPNHYLDLSKWTSMRHFPLGPIDVAPSVGDSVGIITNLIKSNIKAVTVTRPAYLPITAGRDSRMLLACARDEMRKIQLITFVPPREDVNQYIVKRLGNAQGFSSTFIPLDFASSAQREDWYAEIGHCLGGRIAEIHPTLAALSGERVILPGLGGEVGRGYYYRSRDDRSPIEANDLLRRFQLPPHPVLQRALSGWLSEIRETLTTPQILDLAYIEHRLGAWGGPQTYGQVRFVDHMYPLFDRRAFELILSLPAEYKGANRLPQDIIAREWPELLGLPFNRFVGIRHWYEKTRRLYRLPRKLRRMLS